MGENVLLLDGSRDSSFLQSFVLDGVREFAEKQLVADRVGVHVHYCALETLVDL